MMKPYAYLLSLGLAGCMANNCLEYDSVAQNNLYHVARTRKGMTEREVLAIMHKPYSYESFEVGDDVYDVWFYVTRTTGLGQTRMVPQNLTPLTFKKWDFSRHWLLLVLLCHERAGRSSGGSITACRA